MINIFCDLFYMNLFILKSVLDGVLFFSKDFTVSLHPTCNQLVCMSNIQRYKYLIFPLVKKIFF